MVERVEVANHRDACPVRCSFVALDDLQGKD
jgi:hypothetical protein